MCLIILAEGCMIGWVFEGKIYTQGHVQKVDTIEINKIPLQIISVKTQHGDCIATMQSNLKKYEVMDDVTVADISEKGECRIAFRWLERIIFAVLMGNLFVISILYIIIEEYKIGAPAIDKSA